jgi:hypothetical protein
MVSGGTCCNILEDEGLTNLLFVYAYERYTTELGDVLASHILYSTTYDLIPNNATLCKRIQFFMSTPYVESQSRDS